MRECLGGDENTQSGKESGPKLKLAGHKGSAEWAGRSALKCTHGGRVPVVGGLFRDREGAKQWGGGGKAEIPGGK